MTEHPTSEPVVIVGGGIAGLVAARRLLIEGHPVTLLEAGDRLGGSVAHQRVGGFDLDAGAESFVTAGGVVERLVNDLGLSDAVVKPLPLPSWIQPADGAAFALPASSLSGIPGSPLAADVTAIIGAAAAARAFIVDALLPGTVGAKARTLDDLVRVRMGDGVLQQLVAPVIRGSRNLSPAEVGPADVSPGLLAALRREGSLARAVRDLQWRTADRGGAAGIRGGLFRMVEELVADLERFGADVRLGTRATAVSDGQVFADGTVFRGTVVVAAAGLVGPPAAPASPLTLATLVVDAPELDAAPRGTGILVAEGAPDIRARSLSHRTAKWSWLAERAAGRHVVRLSYDAPVVGLAGLAEWAEAARTDAQALLGVDLPRGQVIDFAVTEWLRPTRSPQGAADAAGITVIGESVSGTGLAATIAHAEEQALRLFAGDEG